MSDTSSGAAKPTRRRTKSSSMKTMFPGYFPPSSVALRRFVVDGLVVLDTNALLDVYRFTDTTRAQYLQVLGLLGNRLWIPHQTGHEFFERRTTVIRQRHDVRDNLERDFANVLDVAVAAIAQFARRRGLGDESVQPIAEHLAGALIKVLAELDETADTGAVIDPDAHPDSDPILQEVLLLLEEKIGDPFEVSILAGLQRIGQQRLTANIPPGYRDSSKGGDRSIGDFLVWEQTMREAEKRKMPVLMITNEQKPDWVREDGVHIGPRSELVKEMRDRADQDFHLVDARTFLTLAQEHLAAEVSEASVDEASRLGRISEQPEQVKDAVVAAPAARAYARAFSPEVTGTIDTRWVDGLYSDQAAGIMQATQQIYGNALKGWNPAASLDSALKDLNPTARLDAALKDFNPTARLDAALKNLNPFAGLRDSTLKNLNPTYQAALAAANAQDRQGVSKHTAEESDAAKAKAPSAKKSTPVKKSTRGQSAKKTASDSDSLDE
ncbi:PIN-like domain-containing protein [Nocardia sp. NPDC004278]